MKELSILITGPAGSGIQTIENLLCRIFTEMGLHTFATKEYMSRVRGGANTTTIRISEERVDAFSERIDILLSLDRNGIDRIQYRIGEDTLIFGDVGKNRNRNFEIDFVKIAEKIGNKIYANTVAVGFILGIIQKGKEIGEEIISGIFNNKGKEILDKNIDALNEGYLTGIRLANSINFNFTIKESEEVKKECFFNGAVAIGIGSIIGGCNFVSSYPMTPSTPVFSFLAQNAKDFNIIVEQAEDEIAAINMVLGSWYAGGRGFVTTSGGGFALMVESLSLAGMTETPIVIHLAQRPGPATGLPTRTEQSDLLFALFAGHGEFPRIILSPGDLYEGIFLTANAFNLADRYQIPVIILSDQYFIDSYYNIPVPEISNFNIEYSFLENTDRYYKRYQLTDDGISIRGIPGGDGFVCVDSDEHNEEGHITEDREITRLMVEKRNRKLNGFINSNVINPSFYGNRDYEILLISWGSTKNTVIEAVKPLSNIGYLSLPIVYPLPDIKDYIKKSKKTIIIENNYTSQLAKLIRMETGIEIKEKILKYDGHPFSVEEIQKELGKKI